MWFVGWADGEEEGGGGRRCWLCLLLGLLSAFALSDRE